VLAGQLTGLAVPDRGGVLGLVVRLLLRLLRLGRLLRRRLSL
jgi:hypothetical protein